MYGEGGYDGYVPPSNGTPCYFTNSFSFWGLLWCAGIIWHGPFILVENNVMGNDIEDQIKSSNVYSNVI